VKTEVQNSGALSRLYIANAAKRDSGNYTCALEEVSATTVAVHVLRGTYYIKIIDPRIKVVPIGPEEGLLAPWRKSARGRRYVRCFKPHCIAKRIPFEYAMQIWLSALSE
jgi:hypothetical protein